MGGRPPQTPLLIAGAERSFFLPPKARFARLGITYQLTIYFYFRHLILHWSRYL